MHDRDSGQISVLLLGVVVLVIGLIMGAIDLTAAQIARVRLLDTADAVALDAADAIGEGTLYRQTLGDSIPLTDADVWRAASDHLSKRDLPNGVSSWHLERGTGAVAANSAAVVLTGDVRLPISGWFMEKVGSSVDITVTSRATTRSR